MQNDGDFRIKITQRLYLEKCIKRINNTHPKFSPNFTRIVIRWNEPHRYLFCSEEICNARVQKNYVARDLTVQEVCISNLREQVVGNLSFVSWDAEARLQAQRREVRARNGNQTGPQIASTKNEVEHDKGLATRASYWVYDVHISQGTRKWKFSSFQISF